MTARAICPPPRRSSAKQVLTLDLETMWTLLVVGAVASIAFGLVAFLWADFRPLTDEERSRLDF